MIQSVIDRHNRSSFAMKGWSVTVGVALLGFGTKESDAWLAVLAAYAVAAFGALDAYYLALERAYRDLYVTAVGQADTDWGMAATTGAAGVFKALQSPSVWILHGIMLFVAIAIAIALAVTA